MRIEEAHAKSDSRKKKCSNRVILYSRALSQIISAYLHMTKAEMSQFAKNRMSAKYKGVSF